jgi:hypothetical protein
VGKRFLEGEGLLLQRMRAFETLLPEYDFDLKLLQRAYFQMSTMYYSWYNTSREIKVFENGRQSLTSTKYLRRRKERLWTRRCLIS